MSIINQLRNDSLVNSSFHLILASGISAGLGFLFWVVAARKFTSAEVGIASTLIFIMYFLSTLTLLGFDIGIIRFWKRKKHSSLVGSSVMLCFLASICAGSAAVILLSRTRLSFLLSEWWMAPSFVILTSGWVLFNLADSIYIAMGQTEAVVIKQALFSALKIGLLSGLVWLGFFGPFVSWTIAATAVLAGLVIFFPIPLTYSISTSLVKGIIGFSLLNYIASILIRLRELSLPILVH